MYIFSTKCLSIYHELLVDLTCYWFLDLPRTARQFITVYVSITMDYYESTVQIACRFSI